MAIGLPGVPDFGHCSSCTLKSGMIRLNKCQIGYLPQNLEYLAKLYFSRKTKKFPLRITERKHLAPYVCVSVGHMSCPIKYFRTSRARFYASSSFFKFSIKTEEHSPWGIPRSGEIRALFGRPERTPSTPLK